MEGLFLLLSPRCCLCGARLRGFGSHPLPQLQELRGGVLGRKQAAHPSATKLSRALGCAAVSTAKSPPVVATAATAAAGVPAGPSARRATPRLNVSWRKTGVGLDTTCRTSLRVVRGESCQAAQPPIDMCRLRCRSAGKGAAAT